MNSIFAILVIGLTILLGFLIVRKFKIYKEDILIQICLGFAFGMGIISLQMITYSLIGLDWSQLKIIAPNVFVLIILGLPEIKSLKFRKNITSIKGKLQSTWLKIKQNPLKLVFFALIILLVSFVFFESLIRPLTSWDSWASWQMKSKMYFYDGAVTSQGFQYLKSEYPLTVSLYSTFIYKTINSLHETSAILVSAFCYLFIGIMSFSMIKKSTNTMYALVFTFLILSSQNLIRHGGRYEGGNADIVMAFFVLAVVALFMKVTSTKKNVGYSSLFILLAITSNIKNEGIIFAFLAFLFIFALAWKKKAYLPIYQSLLMIIPVVGWFAFKHFYSLPPGILSSTPILDPALIFGIFKVELFQYLNIQNWNLGWIFVGMSLIYLSLSRKLPPVLILLITQAIFYYGVFLFSSVNPVEHARGISDRLFLHLFPAFVVCCAISLYPFIKKHGLMIRFKLA